MQKVGARIAYLRDEQALAFEHGSGERGAHAVAPDALAGGLHHVVVGCFNRSSESFGIEMAGCEFGKRIHGDLGSDLACFMTAHAICYGKKWRNDDETVFVVIAHVANVCAASERYVLTGCVFVAVGGHLCVPYPYGHIADHYAVAVLECGWF